MRPHVRVRHQERKSLAMRATPDGVEVLIPPCVDPKGAEVAAFVEAGLDKLTPPEPVPAAHRVDEAGVRALVEEWTTRLGVDVTRVQLRQMRRKWGSMSTRGTLTLARDLTHLPHPLVEYVVVHELLHLVIARHGGMFELLLGRHLPDWREREKELGKWTVWIGA
jgi:predicted metal-dependent hydrolase